MAYEKFYGNWRVVLGVEVCHLRRDVDHGDLENRLDISERIKKLPTQIIADSLLPQITCKTNHPFPMTTPDTRL